MKEVVMGLWELVCEKIDGLMKNASIEEKKAVKENYRWAFMFMLISIDYDAIDTDLTTEDFQDPEGKVVSIILYLNTIEPYFFGDLNIAIRSLDKSKLATLGPFARCLY